MRTGVRSLAPLAALALAACGGSSSSAPWLTMPSPSEHAGRYFPYGPGTVHATASCDDCHGTLDSFRKFDCLHCHTGDHTSEVELAGIHAGFPGYAFDSPTCYGCHRDGTSTHMDHSPFFPTAEGSTHAAARCADCHVDPSDRKVLGCAGCHPHEQATTAVQHGRVADFAFESARCARCHAESEVKTVASHAPFLVDAGSHQGPAGGACLTCHPASRTDKAWATDFAVVDCLGCHGQAATDGAHAGKPDYGWTTSACLGCHPAGTIDHTGYFPIGAGSRHADATCAQCHVDPADRSVLGCAGCHPHEQATVDPQHLSVPDYAFDSAGCVRCHAESQVTTVASHLPFAVEVSPHQGTEGGACLQCHTASVAAKPWATDFTVKDCLGCHAQPATDTQHLQVGGYAWASASCLSCHPDGKSVDHAPIFPIALGTAHAAARCDDCHVSATDRTVLGCAGCHPHESATAAAQHLLVSDYAFDSSRCARCHADSQVNPVASHLPFVVGTGPHTGTNGGACLRCHPSVRTDKTWGADFTTKNCLGCHTAAETNPHHSGVADYLYTTAACLGCHPAGRQVDSGP